MYGAGTRDRIVNLQHQNLPRTSPRIYFSDISALFTEASCEHMIYNISQDLPDTRVSLCIDRNFHVAGHSVTLPSNSVTYATGNTRREELSL